MEKTSNKIKLGLLVLAGTILLIVTLYLVGSKQNLFSRTIPVYVRFNNVNGLLPGNNVRFAGIAIGTVQDVFISDDSTVVVKMVIRQDATRYIRKNSFAEIGSDGLMGNRLINISSASIAPSNAVEPGDTILARQPLATDDMMRTLSSTNDNVLVITSDLRKVVKRVNESTAIWDLLADSMAAENVRRTLRNLETASSMAGQMSYDAEMILTDLRKGNGMAGKILTDDTMATDLSVLVENLRLASDTARIAIDNMSQFMRDLNMTPGPLGVLARDTVMAQDIKSMISNLDKSTSLLNENLEAMRSNFLFKRFFKKKDKQKAK